MTGTKLKVTVLYDLWEEEPVAVEEEVPAPRKRKGQKKRKTKPVKHDREEIFEALEKLGHEQRTKETQVVFVIIRPPPRSTLFPYTTLCRSAVRLVGRRACCGAGTSS